jgi:outer membrane beta-barrel protein
MRTVKLLPLTLLAAAAFSSVAHADRRNPLTGTPALRNKVEMRKLRFEISPQFLVSINQDYKHSFGVGANLEFYITDWLGIGVQGSYMFNTNTALENAIRDKLPDGNVTPYMYPGPQPTRQIHDQHVLGINALLSAYAQLVPFAGKFALFSSLFFRYDFYVNAGVGMVNFTQDPKCCSYMIVRHPLPGETVGDPNTEDAGIFAGLKVGGQIGVGMHMFFNEWIGMQLELRDYIVGANQGGGDVNGDRHLTTDDEGVTNNIFFGVGVTLMLPPHAKVTH